MFAISSCIHVYGIGCKASRVWDAYCSFPETTEAEDDGEETEDETEGEEDPTAKQYNLRTHKPRTDLYEAPAIGSVMCLCSI